MEEALIDTNIHKLIEELVNIPFDLDANQLIYKFMNLAKNKFDFPDSIIKDLSFHSGSNREGFHPEVDDIKTINSTSKFHCYSYLDYDKKLSLELESLELIPNPEMEQSEDELNSLIFHTTLPLLIKV